MTEEKTKKWADSFKSTKTEKNLDAETEQTVDSIDNNIIVKLQEENASLKDKLLRVAAELENSKRIMNNEIEKTARYSITNFAKDLIPVMEAFYLAEKNKPTAELTANFKSYIDGIDITYNEIKKVFEKNNLVRVSPLNEKFNPEIHQAIVQLPSKEDEGTIIEVMQAGYTLNDRLIRQIGRAHV